MNPDVVVCAYTDKRWDLIAAVLESLHHQSLHASQVVVVVDHNDSLLTQLRTHVSRKSYPDTVVIPNRFARGLSGARNTGLAASDADIVAFIDDDAAADVHWLHHLCEPFGDPRVVGVGGAISAVWPVERPHWFPPEFDWVVGCSYRGMPETRSDIRNPIGANMAFRRKPLERIGGFDPSVGRVGTQGQGCEETAAAIRLRQLDPRHRVVFEPRALVRHHVAQERTTWRYFRQRCFAEGKSKAQLTRLTNSPLALATERSYVRRVLPRAIGQSIQGALREKDPARVGTACAVLAGLVFTSVGYITAAPR